MASDGSCRERGLASPEGRLTSVPPTRHLTGLSPCHRAAEHWVGEAETTLLCNTCFFLFPVGLSPLSCQCEIKSQLPF